MVKDRKRFVEKTTAKLDDELRPKQNRLRALPLAVSDESNESSMTCNDHHYHGQEHHAHSRELHESNDSKHDRKQKPSHPPHSHETHYSNKSEGSKSNEATGSQYFDEHGRSSSHNRHSNESSELHDSNEYKESISNESKESNSDETNGSNNSYEQDNDVPSSPLLIILYIVKNQDSKSHPSLANPNASNAKEWQDSILITPKEESFRAGLNYNLK